ncbi:hypothetical protein QJS04_geneDACA023271 [Acorus gramineus]|uniref:Uncharacterized protein n=1 Tax=Acorus gramineus TaxID=55184 RepID=A0AAV9BI08_ACOGR|nr:hypothetical protein QJS04_geneDACA023271 [Acorus gramineus]
MITPILLFILLLTGPPPTTTTPPESTTSSGGGSIVFTTLGRSRYAFDIFTLPISNPSKSNELRLTDGRSVNYNGFSPSPSSLLYVSERGGHSNLYLKFLTTPNSTSPKPRREALQVSPPLHLPLINEDERAVSMKDRPTLSGEHLIYVSTRDPSHSPRHSWSAVYSTHLRSGETRRLTPMGIADFSPAVSPSGEWTAVASSGEAGWDGEVEELATDVYVFRTSDGSGRMKVVERGGWPCWESDSALFFHRRGRDGWWSVYRARLDSGWSVERVTPPGVHAFTPAASPAWEGKYVVVATRRPGREFRHVELFDVGEREFIELTTLANPDSHHYNPFVTADGASVGYHRCNRGARREAPLLLENLRSPGPIDVPLFRIDGSFPSFSPDGARIAYVGLPGLYVVNADGTGAREVLARNAFATAWDWKRKGVVYTSLGPEFASEASEVDVVSVHVDGEVPIVKKLTVGGENNAFPSPSADGKWIVFRSGRSGHKNLYVMDAEEGERASLRRLTVGPWTDTMCNWSPDGEWIVFASDRDNPGGGGFALYLIRPDGTGLEKVVESGDGGRVNHPWFSPDSKSIVFTSDYAAVSAEPIANPHHYQPYGDIFTVRLGGGEGVRRLTHNSYEDGTPAWGPVYMKPNDVVESPIRGSGCQFDDCHWLVGNGGSANTVLTCPGVAKTR